MTQPNQMRILYGRLRKLGLPTSYVRDTLLPSWWDDSAAEKPAGFVEALMLISRHVGIDMANLCDADVGIELARKISCKFKKSPEVSEDRKSVV